MALSFIAGLQQSICSAQDTRCNGVSSTNWSCCSYNEPCNVGGGDCDRDSDCLGSLKCGNDNCRNDFSTEGSNWSAIADCCYGKFSYFMYFPTPNFHCSWCTKMMIMTKFLNLDFGADCQGTPSTDWNCCSDAFPCLSGGGDCDEDSQCDGDLVCGSDNCLRDFSSGGSNWVAGADCCRGNLTNITTSLSITV